MVAVRGEALVFACAAMVTSPEELGFEAETLTHD